MTKYNRQFILRLYLEDAKMLEVLKEYLKLSTDVAAIRHAILEFINREGEIERLKEENAKLEETLSNLTNRITDFKSAFEQLTI